MKQLQAKVDELQKTLQEVLTGKAGRSSAPESPSEQIRWATQSQLRRPQRKFACWNCGDLGHQRRDCPKEMIGDGFTNRRQG